MVSIGKLEYLIHLLIFRAPSGNLNVEGFETKIHKFAANVISIATEILEPG